MNTLQKVPVSTKINPDGGTSSNKKSKSPRLIRNDFLNKVKAKNQTIASNVEKLAKPKNSVNIGLNHGGAAVGTPKYGKPIEQYSDFDKSDPSG